LTNSSHHPAAASFEKHIGASLGVDMPDFWAILGEYAPYALDGYLEMRRGVFGRAEDGATSTIPKQYLEMMVVALNIAQDNHWGLRTHTRAALRAGATPDELVQLVVLTIMSTGMVSYRKTGYLVLEELRAYEAASSEERAAI
jgi:AhpD family alkylhydroperoxidase